MAIFNYFQKNQVRKQEMRTKQQFKSALRSTLYIFLNLAYSSISKRWTDLSFKDAVSSKNGIEQLINLLRHENEMSGMLQTWLIEAANKHVGTVQSLLPLAAQIDIAHLELWSMIIQDIESGLVN